jgi:hypothetical protein
MLMGIRAARLEMSLNSQLPDLRAKHHFSATP